MPTRSVRANPEGPGQEVVPGVGAGPVQPGERLGCLLAPLVGKR